MLQYRELRHVDFLEAEERGIAFEETADAARRFIDNFLSPEGFVAVAILRSPTWLAMVSGNGRRDVAWIVSLAEAKKKRRCLLHGMQKGFDALFVLSTSAEQAREWFGSCYELSESGWSEITEHAEPVAYMDNDNVLRQHVMTMVLEPGQCACLVTHDYDPIYLIRAKP